MEIEWSEEALADVNKPSSASLPRAPEISSALRASIRPSSASASATGVFASGRTPQPFVFCGFATGAKLTADAILRSTYPDMRHAGPLPAAASAHAACRQRAYPTSTENSPAAARRQRHRRAPPGSLPPGPPSLRYPPAKRNPQGGRTLSRAVLMRLRRFGAPAGGSPAHHGPRFGLRLPLRF